MNIAIIGGGNIGTYFACVCAAKGHCVKIFTSRPNDFCGHLDIVDSEKKVVLSSDIRLASNKIEDIVYGVD